MATRIGLISDIHATVKPVIEAFSVFKEKDVDQVLCAGDIAGYGEELEETINLLIANNCVAIQGNHEVWYLEKIVNREADKASKYFDHLGYFEKLNVEDKSLYMVHANPPEEYMGGIRLLDEDGQIIDEQINEWQKKLERYPYDVLIVGHTHQVFAQVINDTLVINPGSSKFNHSCAILTLPEMTIEWIPLSGKPITKTWNWGTYLSKVKKENNNA
ncbi:MAG: metallophosphatase family protein [Gammaproteobacteria bacterium]|nr:metallophosphatase family protein [Gammaproteobacteria bacterium]MCW9055663.1 metallophosphatase family protein [Gammaproteobacteria bacterium]